MKHVFRIILFTMLVFAFFLTIPNNAKAEIASGTWGALQWSLSDDGTLTISGSGNMLSFGSYTSNSAWRAYNSEINRIIIEDGVTSIGEYAFANNSMTTIDIPDSVLAIETWAFHGCKNLVSIELPKCLETIGDMAFIRCNSLIEITIPGSVYKIEWEAFSECENLKKVTFQDGVHTIWINSFRNCRNLSTVILPNTIEVIGLGAFAGCDAINTIDIPTNVQDIGDGALSGNTTIKCKKNSYVDEWATELGYNIEYNGIALSEIRLNSENLEILYLNKPITKQLSAQIIPENSTENEIQWECWNEENENIATVDSNGLVTILGPGKCTIAAIPKSKFRAAQYCFIEVKQLYTIKTTTNGHGVASANITEAIANTDITLSTIPDEGYQFVKWNVLTGNIEINDNKFKISDKNVEIEAVFEPLPTYSVTLSTDDNGTASADVSEGWIGTEVNLTAKPKEGYRFYEWIVLEGDVNIQDGKFVMGNENVSIMARFVPVPIISRVKFAKSQATVKQQIAITTITSTNVIKLSMYNGKTLIKSWTDGYTDNDTTRTWNVTYAFAATGDKTMTFKAEDEYGIITEGKKASITITKAPTLSSAKFSKAQATVKQDVTITAVTSTNTVKLAMYNGTKVVKSWTDGYTDKDGKRTWKITYAFTAVGDKNMSFKAIDVNGYAIAAKEAKITITKAPTLSSAKFSKAQATVKQNITITAVTSTNTTKLAMYNGTKVVKSWTDGYTDKDGKRTWKITYAFTATGDKTMSFKAIDENGYATTVKTAKITITKAPTLSSVKFSKTQATVKQNVTITAVTSTNTTKLAMYNGTKAVKSWTEGYTDNGTKRTWKITYAFTAAGDKTMSFKAIDANGYATTAKEAKITITKAPTLSSVKFSSATGKIKKNVTIVAVTSTNTTKLTMYNSNKAVKSWTDGYTDSGTKRTWKVTYAFSGTGTKKMSFKAIDANGYATAAKEATIEITK